LRGRFAIGAAALLLAASCRTGRPILGPVPDRIESIQGHASLRVARLGGAGRARLAFWLQPPGRARLEALDPLNRTIFQVAVEDETATLLVPSRKAYWTGARAEVLEAGLGFPLSVAEMAGMLSGCWTSAAGWDLTRDGLGRIGGGRREGFSFRVDEFFPSRPIPRKIVFAAADGSGALTVLGLSFNAPNQAGAGADQPAAVPPSFVRLTRAEMERLLRDED
jgi:outer membrane biogenesis lipoprotein LolB